MPPKKFGKNDPFKAATPSPHTGRAGAEAGADEENELLKYDAQTYGEVPGIPDSGRITAKPLAIEKIHPDLRQPRRVIPASLRGEWKGEPAAMPELFAQWQLIVEQRLDRQFDIVQALTGGGDAEDDPKSDDPIIDEFFAVVQLGASILKDGSINPIRVARLPGGRFMIESGERRWAAYWLLSLYIDNSYERIPAIEKQQLDVWAQAAENGARKPLNAIGMARQLALLIMDMYEGDRGVRFDDYDTLILPGESDRKFYAQVANGTVYRIKRGLGERVLHVTGLKSKKQIWDYRSLLLIPDALWSKADEQNWTERAIRDYVSSLKLEQEQNNRSPVGDLSQGVGNSNLEQDQNESVTDVTLQPKQERGSEGQEGGNLESGGDEGHPPTRTHIGERMGLYDDPNPTQTPAVPDDWDDDESTFNVYDDEGEFTKEDAEIVRESRAAIKRSLDEIDPPLESTTPMIKEWVADGNGDVAAILRLFKSLTTDKVTRMRIDELMTLSREDLRRNQRDTPDHWWAQYVDQAGERLRVTLETHLVETVAQYLEYVKQTGVEFRQQWKKQRQ